MLIVLLVFGRYFISGRYVTVTISEQLIMQTAVAHSRNNLLMEPVLVFLNETCADCKELRRYIS